MNASMLPMYGANFLAKRLRKFATYLEQSAELIEARHLLTSQQHSVLQRNAEFSGKHKGQPAFVIVNGPSLATQDILRLKDRVTFVVSGFWKHEALLSWQPTYYSLLDANFFTDTPATRMFYQNLHQRVHSSTFFVPLFRGYDAVHKHKFLPENKTYYVASIGEKASNNDLTNIVQGFAGVSAFALSQAIYMGCSPIYLLGFDHDYLANRGVDRHFYTGGTLPGHQNTNVPLADRIAYDDEMRANLRLWANYRFLHAEAKKKGVEIINCTNGGYLDVFPRIGFDLIPWLSKNELQS